MDAHVANGGFECSMVLATAVQLDGLPDDAASDPPQVTGRWVAEDYVDADRYRYASEKRHPFEWSKDRGEPPWVEEYTVDIEDGPRADA